MMRPVCVGLFRQGPNRSPEHHEHRISADILHHCRLPGTGVLVTLAAGLSRGARASIIAALGCTLGIVPHMLAAVTGLAALLHASALAFEIIKYAGVAYLLYMAWMTLRSMAH